MRLLVVSHYFESHRGGIEIVAGQLARALAETHRAELVWAASDATPPPEGFPGTCEPLRCTNLAERRLGVPFPLPAPGAVRRLAALAAEADAVLVHDALYPTSIAASLAARRAGRPVVVVQHVGHVPYRNALLRGAMAFGNRLVAAPLLSSADRVVFVSGLTERYFAGRCGFRRPPAVIFNGLAEPFVIGAQAFTRVGAQRALGLDDGDRPTVAFVGRFVEKKGLAVLRRMATALPETRFLLAGWGEIAPEGWGLANVRVIRGLSGAGLVAVYRAADLFVLPSVGEGFPLVVQEALACGTPVLCGEDLLAADPWLEGRVAAAPVDPADPAATAADWARRAARLLAGEAPLPQCDPEAAVERYRWAGAARAYGDVLAGLVACAPRRAA